MSGVRKKCIFAEKVETMKPTTDTKHKPATLDDGGADATNATPLKKAFIEAYRANTGNATAASSAVGINRTTYWRWYNSDHDFAAAVDAVDEEQIDTAESELSKHIKSGNLTAIIFYLKTKGQGRGYVERVETDSRVVMKDAKEARDKLLHEFFDEQE